MYRYNLFFQLVKSLILLGIAAGLCYVLPRLGSLYAVFAATLLLSLLAVMVNSYCHIIGVTAKTLTFDSQGWIVRVLGWRVMAYILILGLAFVSSLCFIIHVPSLHTIGFVFIFLTAPLFAGVYCCFRKIFAGQSVDWMITGRTLFCSLWVTPLLMVVLYALFLHYSGLLPVYETLDAAVEAQPKPWEGAHSELLQTIGGWSILWGACRDFGFVQLFQINEYLSIILVSLGNFALFFNVCSLLAFLYVPLREYKRLLLPLTPSLELPPISPRQFIPLCPVVIILASLCSTLFIWQERIGEMVPDPEPLKVNLIKIGDYYVKQDVPLLINELDRQLRAELEQVLAGPLGKLEGYEGTLAQFQKEKEALLGRSAELKNNTYRELRKLHEEEMFPLIERNVENYLNWYYSITGEYVRLLNLAAGNFEQHMKDKLNEHLMHQVNLQKPQEMMKHFSDEFKIIATQMEQIEKLANQLLEQAAEVSEEAAQIIEEYRIKRMQGIEALIAKNEVPHPGDLFLVEIDGDYASVDDFLESFQDFSAELSAVMERFENYTHELQKLIKNFFALHSDEFLSFNNRMTAAGFIGVGGALLSARMAARIAAKPLFREAAEVVVKQIIKRSTGIGGGAAAGAAAGGGIGSAVPVVGTTVGAFVGGIIGGAAAWIATDYVLIKLEEYISRESFKREIIYGINEQKAEVMKALDDLFQINHTSAPPVP